VKEYEKVPAPTAALAGGGGGMPTYVPDAVPVSSPLKVKRVWKLLTDTELSSPSAIAGQRSLSARYEKARRGELIVAAPIHDR
jgi:hypothetical protein